MRLFNRYFSAYDLALPIGDVTITLFAVFASRFVVVVGSFSAGADWEYWTLIAGCVSISVLLSFYYADLYEIDQVVSQRELVLRFANGFGIACLLIAAFSYPIPQPGLRQIYTIQIVLMGAGLFVWRLVFTKLLNLGKIRANIAIVGTQQLGRIVAEELAKRKYLGVQVACFVGPEPGQVTLTYGNPRKLTIPIISPAATLQLVKKERISRILIAGPVSGQNFPAKDLLTLRVNGIPVEDCHTFYERLTSKILITDLRPSWILLSRGFQRTAWVMAAKKALDVLVASVGLFLAAPIALVTAIAIKLDSRGPIIYCQERVGFDEIPFMLYKFRSMYCNAEEATGPQWAAKNDPRVTRIGRILRTLRIDELPQLVNVLMGDMSLVGPRPERSFFVSQLKEEIPYYYLRFTVKPGITGWAQISYGYADDETDAVQKLEYDLYYTKHMSPMFDLQILFETVKVVLLGRGAQ